MSQMSEIVGASTSRNPKGLHGLYRDNFTFFLLDGGELLFICLMRFAYGERKWNSLDIKAGLDPEPI
jgi:hypothetical protein